MLLNLVEALLVDIFSNWILAKDYCKLDSAFCNEYQRFHFTNLPQVSKICLSHHAYLGYESEDTELSFILWLKLKNIHCKCLCFNFEKLKLSHFNCIPPFTKKSLTELVLKNGT